MRCQNKFCIYNCDGDCFVEEVPHDENGRCIRCIYVKVTDEELRKLKSNTVDDLEYIAGEKVKKHNNPAYFGKDNSRYVNKMLVMKSDDWLLTTIHTNQLATLIYKKHLKLLKLCDIIDMYEYKQGVRAGQPALTFIYKNVKRGVLYGKKHSFTCLGFS